ncbi:DUF2842 domain-containing protein [Croceibacterium sp. TMG7-5b_MA50]|uniref:DUF2842 domain-containing protein n=1 Tax=Croceibacterium sp. TMG7-5b_MA50 TaxID=3121290 RepID=UPI003221570A
MRERPTLRIPLGVLLLLAGLALYAGLVVQLTPWIGTLPVWLQAVVYLFLGVAWLLPLRRFLIWMETGRWG